MDRFVLQGFRGFAEKYAHCCFEDVKSSDNTDQPGNSYCDPLPLAQCSVEQQPLGHEAIRERNTDDCCARNNPGKGCARHTGGQSSQFAQVARTGCMLDRTSTQEERSFEQSMANRIEQGCGQTGRCS